MDVMKTAKVNRLRKALRTYKDVMLGRNVARAEGAATAYKKPEFEAFMWPEEKAKMEGLVRAVGKQKRRTRKYRAATAAGGAGLGAAATGAAVYNSRKKTASTVDFSKLAYALTARRQEAVEANKEA